MPLRFEDLKARFDELHAEFERGMAERQEKFRYTIEKGKIRFQEATRKYHKTLRHDVLQYIRTAPILYVLTSPFIYACIIPFVMVDIMVSLYQIVCFPVYNIPKVRRSDYLKLDRHKLNYLNIIQKINCEYCSYGNGILAYASEIASRTELFWCPIKHAKSPKAYHERYVHFIDYGDAEGFEKSLDVARAKAKACEDCNACSSSSPASE